MTSKENNKITDAGLPHDPIAFKAMVEIGIISQLADNFFTKYLPQGLTIAQFGVLNHLMRLDRQETIGELAAAMQVSQPTMSSTVRKLEDKGFISLVFDDADRRIRRVKVSSAGEDIRNDSIARVLPQQEILFANLSQTDWSELLTYLTRIRVVLDNNR